MLQQPDENLYIYRVTRERLFPRLKNHFAVNIRKEPSAWQAYFDRLEIHFPRLFMLYYQLYARQYDFYYHLEDLPHFHHAHVAGTFR